MVTGGEQAPTIDRISMLPHKEGHHAALTLTCPLCERETSQTGRLHQQDDRGTGVPSVQGPR